MTDTNTTVTLLPTASQLATACKAIAYATKRIDESKVKLANVSDGNVKKVPAFLQAMIESGKITVKAKGEGQRKALQNRIVLNEKRLSEKMAILESVGMTLSDITENTAELLAK